MSLTDDQRLAIDIRDANVLVSAAAGSGKTMVLTERIVARIADRDEPVDIDRMLVMTFTNAAAEEMRNRIREAIGNRLDEAMADPAADRDHVSNLEKQSILVHAANITTIHGFCKKVITDHFEAAGLDPNFRVADENECRLIRQDALEECMESAYQRQDSDFYEAVECFSGAKGDRGFSDLIIPAYEFIMSNPDPERFIEECRRFYTADSFGEYNGSGLAAELGKMLRGRYSRIKAGAYKALELIDEYEELEPYRANVEAYTGALGEIDAKLGRAPEDIYDILRTGFAKINAPAFGRISGSKLSEDAAWAKAEVKRRRDLVKDEIEKLLAMMPFDLATSLEHIRRTAPVIKAFTDTVQSFGEIYAAKKRDKNIIDFGDMEHMAVAVLRDPKTAQMYREHFVEIYVDEYQDSNMTQETLVSLICRRDPGNVFQVGDVKQSIYRFRQARPDLFLSKYNTYGNEGADRRILLNDNFRSRREIVDSVNEVFGRIMKEDLGGIGYKEEAWLAFGADCYDNGEPCNGDSYRTELIVGAADALSAEESEANIIAERILSMVREGFRVYDKREKITRPVSFGDFVILVRSIKKFEKVFRDVFASASIPLAVSGREGYFTTVEVQTALAFLSAVDNPLCDIPVASVALSPVGGFSDTDLAGITAWTQGEKMCLYDRIESFAAGNEGEIAVKCKRFTKLLQEYRVMSTYTPVYGILARFIDNEYGDFVKCMDKSRQRMANLSMLLSKAEDFGKTSFKGLYQFVRYMDQIRKYSIDDGEARTVGENDDVVRLMTIHASKGLEFPVCFIAGMEKRRNRQDEGGRLIWSADCGFGADFTDLDRRICAPTLPKLLIKEENMRESIAEEMRVLYVAMTRAREKLIMVCTDKEDGFDKVKDIEDASSYLDMIKAAADCGGFRHIDIIRRSEEELVNVRFEEKMAEEGAKDELLGIIRKYAGGDFDDKADDEPILLYLSHVREPYPYPVNKVLRAKLSVSELKHQAIEDKIAEGMSLAPEGERLFSETQPDRYIPKFMRSEGESATGGTFYGTAFHRVMELWDYSDGKAYENGEVSAEYVSDFVEKMYNLHRMDRQQADAVRPEDVAAFLNSPLGDRMRAAGRAGTLFREQPFVIGMDMEGETVLVQGIIDAYFTGDDGITIVDYKTDRVDSPDMLTDRYRKQLEYYGIALSQITKIPVKALTIYSTRLRREIVMQMPESIA